MSKDAPITLSPSDLTFLWEECRRCFWLKAHGVLRRPAAPFPKVFSRLDHQTKDFYFARRTEEIDPHLPPGRVAVGDRWVRSRPIDIRGLERPIVLAGRIDTALAFDDGSYGIIDFKTSEPRDEHIPFHGRQLHAYALAAESPARGALGLSPVSHLGLLCIEPVAMGEASDGVVYEAIPHYLAIERDDGAFVAFLIQVALLLGAPEPPEPTPGCSYCSYLRVGSMVMLTGLFHR